MPPGDAIAGSLPALTPTAGHTPEAVYANGPLDAASTQAKVTWGASTETDLDHYEIRGVPGDSYTSDDEAMLETVLPNATREFLTDFALSQAGLTARFKSTSS